MKSYHNVRLYPDSEAEYDLRQIAAQPQSGVPRLRDKKLHVGTSAITLRGNLPRKDRVEAWRVSNIGGVWELSFRLRLDDAPLPLTGNGVGLDPGLKNWLTASDGTTYPQHPNAVKLTKLIEEQQLQRDSKHTDSNRYRELSRCIERNEQRLYNAQLDQANKIAHDLITRFDIICFEDIDAAERGIRNDPKYNLDSRKANWSLLRDTIAMRCKEAGKTFVLTPKWYSSQECSECTHWVKMHVDNRWFKCHHCGHESDRDVNAARCILNRGKEVLEGKSIRARTGWWVPIGHPSYRTY